MNRSLVFGLVAAGFYTAGWCLGMIVDVLTKPILHPPVLREDGGRPMWIVSTKDCRR